MRTNGIDERFITGDADDWEKFEKWAQTVPFCLGNPLYHWTHLELKRLFGIQGKLLDGDTAKAIYQECSEKLRSPEFSVRNLMRKMNVKLVCTTEGPLDTLEHHQKIRQDGFEIKVHTAWRPDQAMAVEDTPEGQHLHRQARQQLCNMDIADFRELHRGPARAARLLPRERLPALRPRPGNRLRRGLHRQRDQGHLRQGPHRPVPDRA